MPQRVSVSELSGKFAEFADGEVLFVDIGGSVELPVKVSPARGSKSLVVVFHGAVNRDKRSYPPFLNFRDGIGHTAHQLAVSDATLGLDADLSLGWYAGAPGLLLQNLLPPLFDELRGALDVERVIFMGSSGGGFAALFYSWHCSGSVAVVQVPQTNVWEYHLPGALRRYQATLWPEGIESYGNAPVMDLRDLYTTASDNSIVYIQSTLDAHHLHSQMLPFLASMPSEMRNRIVVKSSFWGRTGHSNVVPIREWDGWLKAALSAEDVDAESLVISYEALGIEKVPRVGKKNVKTDPAEGSNSTTTSSSTVWRHDEQDLLWTNLVAESQLTGGM